MKKLTKVTSKSLRVVAVFFGTISMLFIVLSLMINGVKWKEIERRIDNLDEILNQFMKK